jgi:hypothetical protein
LHGFVTDLNTFAYLCRVRLFPCRVASKKGYQAVSVNAYRFGKCAGRGFDLLRKK